MGEVIAWPEGSIYLWTGTATASALVGYATDTRASFNYGVSNYRTLDGIYHNLYTGQRCDVSIGMLYTPDLSALQTMVEAQTAIHIHLKHTANGVSAGRLLYSGAVDSLSLNGNEGSIYQVSVNYHANVWSAY